VQERQRADVAGGGRSLLERPLALRLASRLDLLEDRLGGTCFAFGQKVKSIINALRCIGLPAFGCERFDGLGQLANLFTALFFSLLSAFEFFLQHTLLTGGLR